MPSFYLIVTTLLLISLALLGFAAAFPEALVGTPTMSSMVSGLDADRGVPE